MRDIKFRAFIDGEMIGADSLAFEEYAPLKDQLGSEENLMQYTGLSDKNGVEIYEGDLLMVRRVRICEVFFHRAAGCWDLYIRNMLSAENYWSVSPSSYCHFTEIIGNIHENPELLEVSK